MCYRLSIIFIFIFGIAFFEFTEGRPHIRHHKGDSKCGRCGPGWGVKKICSLNYDTECIKCEPGTYSPHHNLQPCWICSRCGPGLYEAHPCVSRADTVCDSCHRHAPDNSDYQKKCKGHKSLFLAPEDAQSTGAETSLVNEEDDSIDENERDAILRDDIRAALLDNEKLNEETS